MEPLELTCLCTACEGVFALERSTKSHRIYRGYGGTAFIPLQTPSPTHLGVRALQASAENGCHLCLLLWVQLHPRDRAALLQSVTSLSKDTSCQTHVERSSNCLQVSFSYDGSDFGPHAQTTFNFYRMAGETVLLKICGVSAYTRRH